MMKPNPRPLSITSPGFSTLTADRPPLNKCASDSNLKGDGSGGDGLNNGTDLNREVAALSNKLISAINHQTKLDDSLSATKHELELSKARIRHLEATAKEHADLMASGLLVDKKEVESETQRLLTRLEEESQQRGQAEKDKRHIEQELGDLTTALFDEANKVGMQKCPFPPVSWLMWHKMVSAARKERDAVDRKNEQLRAQLADTESLLASHQEQLAELKAVMQQMSKEREESEAAMSPGIPSTPSMGGRSSKDGMGRMFEALHLIPNPGNLEDMPPCPPTALINLVHPVLRHDTASYKEFRELLHTLKPSELRTPSVSRLSGGSFASIQVMGMGVGLAMASPGQGASSIGSSLFGLKKRSDSNSTTHSPSGSASSTNEWQATINALKETKFFKRAVMEDIEPALRLDCAPGLSWLARRNVMSAITDGTLVIDPMPTAANVSIFACALCGESKPDEQHARTHRMRINESPNAQRYPVCSYCTTRLRSVCDFMAFLRTLKEGLWKCESEGDMKHAWEESVKLREKLFWARIGGGVVPVSFCLAPASLG